MSFQSHDFHVLRENNRIPRAAVSVRRSNVYFHVLAILATILLWGTSVWNGTVKALLAAVWTGNINGIPLRTVYVGFPPVDYLIAILVSFFFYGTNGHDEGFQLFLIDAYSSLQPAFVWLYLEAARSGPKPYWIQRPMIFGILWQCLGGAIALPIYFACHIRWSSRCTPLQIISPTHVYGITPGFLLGAVIPAIWGLAPAWRLAEHRLATRHQTILGIWQLDPVWVSLVQHLVATLSVALLPKTTAIAASCAARRLVRLSYFFAVVTSAMGHLYVVWAICTTSNDEIVNPSRMYIPFHLTGPSGTSRNILVNGPWLFLQYDLIIINLASLSWVYYLLGCITSQWRVRKSFLFAFLVVGSISIGPGATVSLALWYREDLLPIS